MTYIRQALAWWVKYEALPELLVELTDRGLKVLDGLNAQNVSDQQFMSYRAHTREIAETKIQQLTEHLEDSDYSGYYTSKNPDLNVTEAGGILFPQERSAFDDDDDDPWNDNL